MYDDQPKWTLTLSREETASHGRFENSDTGYARNVLPMLFAEAMLNSGLVRPPMLRRDLATVLTLLFFSDWDVASRLSEAYKNYVSLLPNGRTINVPQELKDFTEFIRVDIRCDDSVLKEPAE